MENSADPAHLQILHQRSGSNERSKAANTTRGHTDDVSEISFYDTPYGIMKKRVYRNGLLDEHPIIFPNILRHQGTQIRVPIDDTHFVHYTMRFTPTPNWEEIDEEPIVTEGRPHKEPAGALHPAAHFTMADVPSQDYMAWETQGPIVNRAIERLATSDKGVVLYRDMLKREVERMQQGHD